jgi:hypothetical protein
MLFHNTPLLLRLVYHKKLANAIRWRKKVKRRGIYETNLKDIYHVRDEKAPLNQAELCIFLKNATNKAIIVEILIFD